MVRGGKSYMYLTDHQGTVLILIGADGANDGAYAYPPDGTLISKSAGGGGSLVTQNLIGYTGALTDTFTAGSSGYVHDGTRWYNPRTGSFASQDTNSYLADPANGNRYAYAADNPANNTDPTGRCAISALCSFGETVWGILVSGGVTGGAAAVVGGGIGCIAAGGPADPAGCGILGTATGLLSGVFGFGIGAGFQIGWDIGSYINPGHR